METTLDNGNWPVTAIIEDLKVQGGLAGVIIKGDHDIEPDENRGGLTPTGTMFIMCWSPGKYLRLIMIENDDVLAEAFCKVLGYRLLCRYKDEDGRVIVEWDKVDMQKRIKLLRRSKNVFDLEVLR